MNLSSHFPCTKRQKQILYIQNSNSNTRESGLCCPRITWSSSDPPQKWKPYSDCTETAKGRELGSTSSPPTTLSSAKAGDAAKMAKTIMCLSIFQKGNRIDSPNLISADIPLFKSTDKVCMYDLHWTPPILIIQFVV